MKKNLFIAGWLMLFLVPAFVGCSKDSAAVNDPITVLSDNKVSIKNDQYNPIRLQVAQGATVTWTNNDNVVHTVTSNTGVFSSGDIQPGQTFSFKFDELGEYFYHCDYHPSMTGSILLGR